MTISLVTTSGTVRTRLSQKRRGTSRRCVARVLVVAAVLVVARVLVAAVLVVAAVRIARRRGGVGMVVGTVSRSPGPLERKRRSRGLLNTTNTLENAIANAGDHRVEQAGGGQRQCGDVVGERAQNRLPLMVARVRRDRRMASTRPAGPHGRGSGPRLDGDVGAGPHGQAEVGLGEGHGVVDAVAYGHHGPRPAAGGRRRPCPRA